MAGRRKPQSVGAGLAYGGRLYASSVCDMNSAAAAAVCGLWRYVCYIIIIIIIIIITVHFDLQPNSHTHSVCYLMVSTPRNPCN